MEDGRYRLRDLDESDFGAVGRLWTACQPDRPVTEPEVRQIFAESDQPGYVRFRRVATEVGTDEVVGAGTLWQDPTRYDPRAAGAAVNILPDHRHHGLGRRLFEELERDARQKGLAELWGGVRAEDLRNVRFFERAGFLERRRAWTSRLDLTAVPSEAPARDPAGWDREAIRFTTVGAEGEDRPDVRERLYHLYVAGLEDVPRLGGARVSSLQQFAARHFEGPGYSPDTMFVATQGDEYVAATILERQDARPEVLYIMFTATLPSLRRRGLAGELKRRSIEFARSHGYRYIETDNDSQNDRIWSINRQLGFRQMRTWIMGIKELRP